MLTMRRNGMRRNVKFSMLIAAAAILLAAATASATTYVVKPDGTGDYPTIQAAIAAVANGSIIELTDGTFIGAGNRDIDFAGKAITVRSQSGNAEACVIDCQGSMSTPYIGVYFDSGEGVNSKLADIKIINGFSSFTYQPLAIYVYSAGPTIDGCVFVDNGIYVSGYASPQFVRNTFRDFNSGGMMQPPISVTNTSSSVATLTIEDNVFKDCTFGGQYSSGTAISVSGTGSATNTAYIRRNVFENLNGTAVALGGTGDVTVWGHLDDNVIKACGNSMMSTPAVSISTNSTSDTHMLMSGNVFVDCQSAAIKTWGYNPNIWVAVDSTTITGCDAGIIKGTAVASLAISHTILWNTDDLNGVLSSEVSCSDIGNGDFLGVNGNFSDDPMFCDAANGDFQINVKSSCVTGYGCGLVGALGVGCDVVITEVKDIPNDQGRRVLGTWLAAFADTGSVSEYTIWGKYEYSAKGDLTTLSYPPGTWYYVMTVPACEESVYSAVWPTLADSNAAGMQYSTFFVRAKIGNSYLDSDPASGYSVDNLPPSVPGGFAGEFDAGLTVLTWDEALEGDFNHYKVYSGSSADFIPGPGNLLGAVIEPTFSDASWGLYYKVSVVDFNGNESAFALLRPEEVTGVKETGAVPVMALAPLTNPLRGQMSLSFSLASDLPGEIVVYDLAGRRVAGKRVSGAGAQTMSFGDLPSGIYWARLTQGVAQVTAKVVVIQ